MGRNLELTTAEKDCLRHYRDHVAQFKAPPTYRQLAIYIGAKHHNTAVFLVGKLREKGYLVEKPVTVMRLRLSSKGRKVAL